MSSQFRHLNLFEELSAEQQELVAGGQMRFSPAQDHGMMMSEEDFRDGQQPEFGPPMEREPQKRVRSIPIRLTGTLEFIK